MQYKQPFMQYLVQFMQRQMTSTAVDGCPMVWRSGGLLVRPCEGCAGCVRAVAKDAMIGVDGDGSPVEVRCPTCGKLGSKTLNGLNSLVEVEISAASVPRSCMNSAKPTQDKACSGGEISAVSGAKTGSTQLGVGMLRELYER
jgi:uncharacterized Zn finger protein